MNIAQARAFCVAPPAEAHAGIVGRRSKKQEAEVPAAMATATTATVAIERRGRTQPAATAS